jgi:hypothetical protein
MCSVGFSIGHVISDRLAVVMRARRGRLETVLKKASSTSVALLTNTVDAAVTSRRPAAGGASASATVNAVGHDATITLLKMIEERDWITPASHLIGNTAGWLIAYYMHGIASAISACSLGSEMVISASQSILDPVCAKFGLPSTRSNEFSELVAVVQSGVVGIAVLRIISVRGLFATHSSLGTVGSLLLFPLVFTEKIVNGAFVTMGVSAI